MLRRKFSYMFPNFSTSIHACRVLTEIVWKFTIIIIIIIYLLHKRLQHDTYSSYILHELHVWICIASIYRNNPFGVWALSVRGGRLWHACMTIWCAHVYMYQLQYLLYLFLPYFPLMFLINLIDCFEKNVSLAIFTKQSTWWFNPFSLTLAST